MHSWQRNVGRAMALRGYAVTAVMKKIRRSIANDAGGAVLEMAISSSILFAMFFGVFEVALASYSSHYVSDAAREGARYAIVRGATSCTNTPNLSSCNASTDTIASYVKGVAYPGMSASNLTVTTTFLTATATTTSSGTATTWAACSSGTCNVPGNMVNVQVSYAFGLNVPFVPKKTINVTSTSQMVIQQ